MYALLLDAEGKLERFQLARAAAIVGPIRDLMDVLRQPLGWPLDERARVVRDFAESWGASLLPPADALRRFDVLLIIPHHFLHGVPLHLIEIEGQPLAVRQGISYCSSSTLLHRCFERNRARGFDPSAWLFPSQNDGATPTGPSAGTCLSIGMDVLTDKEPAYLELAHSFAEHFPDRASADSRNLVKNALAPRRRKDQGRAAYVAPDVLCLVCHGHVDAVRIERSGLLLRARAGANLLLNLRLGPDIVVRVLDLPFAEIPLRLEPVRPSGFDHIFEPELMTISELRVNCLSDAELVALLGCSTGMGEEASNDEYVSLASQWLEVGAASVIANLWEADFAVLTEWSRHFAVNWVELKKPKAIAARDANRVLLEQRPDWARDPLMWGSMALFGDWL